MNVRIKRSDVTSQSVFNVPTDDTWTVMDVLDYIALNFDPSIAYYKHSACNQGICARCALKINGKVGLACTTRATGSFLLLEPRVGKVVRDLVVEP